MSPFTSEPLSQIRSQAVRWLWEPYLARGKLALLDGDPAIGKSLLAIDLAARLSRGSPLPGVAGAAPETQPHVTLLLSAEDAVTDTTRPRAEAAGADLDRVVVLADAAGSSIFFPERLSDLEESITQHRADLVVIDPIMAFLPPAVAANVDQCVRLALRPLGALAERQDCAIVLVRHLRKAGAPRAVMRGVGSVGIIGSARTGLLAARHPADPDLRVLAVTKTNVVGGAPTLTYRIKTNPLGHAVVEWVGTADLSADAVEPQCVSQRPRDHAVLWLQAQLSGGPRKATDLFAAAGEAGVPEATLRRAKSDLGVQSHKHYASEHTVWYWYDPAVAWPANAPFACPYAFRKSDVGPVASPDDFLDRYSLDELFGPRKRR